MAISDPGGFLARPLEVIPSENLTKYLHALTEEEAVAEVVVGVPKTLGGEVGPQAEQVLSRLAELKEVFPTVRFVQWDERLSTRIARSASGADKPSSRRRASRRKGEKERVDHLAAAVMLQEYLNGGGTLSADR